MPHRSCTPPSPDVVVVGAGVIGLAVAWRAAQQGLRVAVLDRGRPGGGTSAVAAGMLAPVAEAEATEQPLLELGIRSAAAYPGFVKELSEQTPLPPGYLSCGTLMAAPDADAAEALVRALALRSELGLPAQRLRGSQARALEPALAPTVRLALELPHDHAVDPRLLTAALSDAVVRAGGEVRSGAAVSGIDCASGRVCGVSLCAGGRIEAGAVVVAAGAWSDQIAGLPAGARVPVRPVKGQILRLHDPDGPGLLSRVLRLEQAYLVPRGDGRYVLGATVEERGFDQTVTAGAVYELLRDGVEVLPGLSELVIDELSAGPRPGTPDNCPIIGAGAIPGLHWATGHYRNGILLAPVTAEIVVAGLAHGPTGADGPFAPHRFEVPEPVAAS